jgi:hypothetical protein
MTRRLGLASLVVVLFAFAGASAGPARPLESRRPVVSIAWQHAPEQVEQKMPRLAPPRPQPSTSDSRVPRSASLRPCPVERWLFQRPPPAAL